MPPYGSDGLLIGSLRVANDKIWSYLAYPGLEAQNF